MAEDMIHFPSLLSACIDVASKAGEIIRTVREGGDLRIHDKGVDDLQTIADVRSQKLIVGSLQKVFPNLSIVGEECLPDAPLESEMTSPALDLLSEYTFPPQLLQVPASQITAWVDPLDGTKEFTEGRVHAVTTLVGLAVNGVAVAGVVHAPFYKPAHSERATGKSIWGVVGLGVFGLEPSVAPAPSRLIALTTRSHNNPSVEKALVALRPDEVRREGGCGAKVIQLLEGHGDVYVFPTPGTCKWDICATEALLRAAGGVLTDIHGSPYFYNPDANRSNTRGLLACARPSAHQLSLALLRPIFPPPQ